MLEDGRTSRGQVTSGKTIHVVTSRLPNRVRGVSSLGAARVYRAYIWPVEEEARSRRANAGKLGMWW